MKEPRKLVISDPEIKTIDLLPQDEFLVMASDGLFDVMEDQSVIDTVGNYLKEHNRYISRISSLWPIESVLMLYRKRSYAL